MGLQTKLEDVLPTTLSRWAAALAAPLAYAPYLLPDLLFAWMPPTLTTVTWLGKLTLALLVLLLLSIVAFCSVLYECYHKSIDIRGAIAEAKNRVSRIPGP